jgi:hypothetical protein
MMQESCTGIRCSSYKFKFSFKAAGHRRSGDTHGQKLSKTRLAGHVVQVSEPTNSIILYNVRMRHREVATVPLETSSKSANE